MSNLIYNLLQKIGYEHPLHPVLVHMPIGLVVAAFLLGVSAHLWRRPTFATTAYQVLVLAFIFYFPTLLMGVVDWQRYFYGAWLPAIKMKLLLALVLFAWLAAGVFIGYRQGAQAKALLPIYLLALLTVTALGYFGGQLTFGGRSPAAATEFGTGQKLYEANCSGCHAHGGNVLAPNYPLRDAPQLQSQDDFVAFLRDPKLPSGTMGLMPAFAADRLSDQDAAELYAYIQRYIAKPQRNGNAG